MLVRIRFVVVYVCIIMMTSIIIIIIIVTIYRLMFVGISIIMFVVLFSRHTTTSRRRRLKMGLRGREASTEMGGLLVVHHRVIEFDEEGHREREGGGGGGGGDGELPQPMQLHRRPPRVHLLLIPHRDIKEISGESPLRTLHFEYSNRPIDTVQGYVVNICQPRGDVAYEEPASRLDLLV